MSLDKDEIISMRESGFTYQEIADEYGVTKQCIHQLINPKRINKTTYTTVVAGKKTVHSYPKTNKVTDSYECEWDKYNNPIIIYLPPEIEAKQYLANALPKLSDKQFYTLIGKLKEIESTIPNDGKQTWRNTFQKEAVML